MVVEWRLMGVIYNLESCWKGLEKMIPTIPVSQYPKSRLKGLRNKT